jgi:hypothetical protein
VKGRKIFRFFPIANFLKFLPDFSGRVARGPEWFRQPVQSLAARVFSAGFSCRLVCIKILESGISPGIDNNYYQMIFPEEKNTD